MFLSDLHCRRRGFTIIPLYIRMAKGKMVIYRSPEASKIRAKILYATSKDGLRRVLEGIHYELQATDPTEMGFDIIQDRAK